MLRVKSQSCLKGILWSGNWGLLKPSFVYSISWRIFCLCCIRKWRAWSMQPVVLILWLQTWCKNISIYWEDLGVWEMIVKRMRLPALSLVQSSNTSWVCFIVIWYKRNWNGSYLKNLTQRVTWNYIFFKFAICSSEFAESWWSIPFKRTRHGNGVADSATAKLLRLWQHASTLWRHVLLMGIVTSHNAWISYEYSLPNWNRP